MTPQERAAKVGEAMFAADVAARETMGIEIVSVAPGRAVLRMAVKPLHLNGHKICHGGFIFTLADTTFAYACNSYNKNAVAAGCSIEFLKPGQDGDVLTCEDAQRAPRHLRHEGQQPKGRSDCHVPWQKRGDPRPSFS